MKLFKKLLHYWFVAASVLSFLGGWVLLAHSPKPVQPTTNYSVSSTLPPIQSFSDITSGGLNNFPSNTQTNPQPNTGFPVLRTGGS